jgi:hypothetical protein
MIDTPKVETDAGLNEQLHAREEQLRALYLQEQRRARHLSLINEVQKCALATREVEAFLPQVTRAVGSHFADCDVTLYLAGAGRFGDFGHLAPDEAEALLSAPIWDDIETSVPIHLDLTSPDEMIVIAGSGIHNLGPALGTRAATRELLEPTNPSLFHPTAKSFLSVPIALAGETDGLILVQSVAADVLDATDVGALKTATAIIASHLQNTRLFRNMREINNFNQSLLNSMLHSLVVVDEEGRIQFVNERLCQTFGTSRDVLLKQPLESIFGESPSRHHGLRDEIAQVLQSGQGREVLEVHVRAPDGPQVFDVRLFRVYFRGQAEAAMLLINLTQRWRQTQRLQLMHEIGRLFQESLDIDRVLSSVLTCITAGSALGFNRAFVLLLDESGRTLEGRMALGPSSADEASRIWAEISQHEMTLPELLAKTESVRGPLSPLQERISTFKIALGNPCFPAIRHVIEQKNAAAVRHDELLCQQDCGELHRAEFEMAAAIWSAGEIAIAPLFAKDRLVGLVLADNLYSGAPIDEGDVQLLDTLAQQAGLTIDNALAYEALQRAQRELVSAERLVAVGEMAARVSHEIRNPLATIGGFARSVLKKPDDEPAVKRKVGVIVSEVARLEELLTDLLDMARPRPLDLQPHSINEVLEHALLLADADIRSCNAVLERDFSTDLPPVHLDRGRILQALLNTIRNGAQAMPDGGILRVSTRLVTSNSPNKPLIAEIEIKDSGIGISQRALKSVFDPFFSTKVSGSGLGLAVTKRIIQDHGGQIDVYSDEGKGTTFIFDLPVGPIENLISSDCLPDAPYIGETDFKSEL